MSEVKSLVTIEIKWLSFSPSLIGFYLQCARQGFALGLTLVAGTFPVIKVEVLMKLIVEMLEVSSSMKRQVNR